MHKFVHYLNPIPSQISAATFVARHLGHTIHSSVSPVYSILPNRTWKHQYLTCILTTLTLDVKQHAMYWEDTVATQDAFHSHHGCTRLQPSWIGAQIVAILPSCSISLSLSLYADFKRPALSVSARFEKHNEKGRIMQEP